MCRYRDGFFNAGSRTGGCDTFLCTDKEMYPKEIRPMPLASCAPVILPEFAGRDSCPSSKVGHPCRTLYAPRVLRAIPDKIAGARRGIMGKIYTSEFVGPISEA